MRISIVLDTNTKEQQEALFAYLQEEHFVDDLSDFLDKLGVKYESVNVTDNDTIIEIW